MVRTGILDVDCSYPAQGRESPEQTKIRILVRSDRSALKLDDFDQREKGMIREAQEHNQLLQELCNTDKEYEQSLHSIYRRKLQVSEFLCKSPTWLKFKSCIKRSTD